MARLNKSERLTVVNNFALGASFVARGDLLTARMHAEITYKVLTRAMGRDDGPPNEPDPANMECHSPHAKWGNWNYCPICGVKLEA